MYRKTKSLLAAAVLLCLVLTACEDDPILGPAGGDAPEGGSYGIIHFQSAASDTTAESGSETGGEDPAPAHLEYRSDNPQRF